jgi:hypothetical protein
MISHIGANVKHYFANLVFFTLIIHYYYYCMSYPRWQWDITTIV